MAYDKLLWLTDPSGDGVADFSGAATTNGAAVDFGANREALAELRVAGTVTGTTPTLDAKIQESADGSTSWTDTGGAFPQQTASMRTVDQAGTGPARIAFRTSKRYIRSVVVVGGTTPVFNSVSIHVLPTLGSGNAF